MPRRHSGGRHLLAARCLQAARVAVGVVAFSETRQRPGIRLAHYQNDVNAVDVRRPRSASFRCHLHPHAAKRRAEIMDQRRGILEKEWMDQPRELSIDVETDHLDVEEPGIQQLAMEAKATGCKSPMAARVMMEQVTSTAWGITEDKQHTRELMRKSRALMIEFAPKNVNEGFLVKQLAQLDNLASTALFRANLSRESAQFANFANSGVKLMRASADHLMLLERLKRPRRRSMRVGSVQVADGGQAVIGDVHVQQRHD